MPPFDDFCRGVAPITNGIPSREKKTTTRKTKEGRGRRDALLRRRKSVFPADGMGISVAPMRRTDGTTRTRTWRRREKRHRRRTRRGRRDIRLLRRRSVFRKVGRGWRRARRTPQTSRRRHLLRRMETTTTTISMGCGRRRRLPTETETETETDGARERRAVAVGAPLAKFRVMRRPTTMPRRREETIGMPPEWERGPPLPTTTAISTTTISTTTMARKSSCPKPKPNSTPTKEPPPPTPSTPASPANSTHAPTPASTT
mmetsp:Transcript_8816/g.16909  ORF Transcript_8816/g.16909 Transcript_8816/m.16909 type:complete len:259 (-) Transcript_8816:116-892(-)